LQWRWWSEIMILTCCRCEDWSRCWSSRCWWNCGCVATQHAHWMHCGRPEASRCWLVVHWTSGCWWGKESQCCQWPCEARSTWTGLHFSVASSAVTLALCHCWLRRATCKIVFQPLPAIFHRWQYSVKHFTMIYIYSTDTARPCYTLLATISRLEKGRKMENVQNCLHCCTAASVGKHNVIVCHPSVCLFHWHTMTLPAYISAPIIRRTNIIVWLELVSLMIKKADWDTADMWNTEWRLWVDQVCSEGCKWN